MTALTDLKQFDVAGAVVTLWIFKKSYGVGGIPNYTGRWIGTTDGLDQKLKEIVLDGRNRISEVHDYSLLAENNESSALAINVDETYVHLIKEQCGAEIDAKRIENVKHLYNADFYVIKVVSGDDVLFGIKKTDASWHTKKKASLISVYFSDEELTLDDDPVFSLAQKVDFFVVDDSILITQKQSFESLLHFKAHHIADFTELNTEADFVAIFSSVVEIANYVGDNKIQLRRASAIRQKGHYKDPIFMEQLKLRHAEFGLNINFDAEGKIIPCPITCRDIFQALLDHRLISGFSKNIYDVQNTSSVPSI